MKTAKLPTSISFLTKNQISNYLALEHSNWCPPDRKIEFMNNWIRNGKPIPNSKEYENAKDFHVATIIRKNGVQCWNEYSKKPADIDAITKKALASIESETAQQNKLAIDIGGGNSTLSLLLLTKGWNVEVVDPSSLALHRLQTRVYQHGLRSLADKNLTLTCQTMEEYKFPKNVSLITAQSSLPYCNPSKIEHVWDKIHDSLSNGGRVAGTFFCQPQEEEISLLFRIKYGAWFANPSIAASFLLNKEYEIESFTYDNTGIDFIGKKT